MKILKLNHSELFRFLLISLIVFSSCNGNENVFESEIDQTSIEFPKPGQTEVSTRSGNSPCLTPYIDLFSSYLQNNRGMDINDFFPEETFGLDPPTLGSFIPIGPSGNSIFVHWNETGEGTLRVTATNDCSGVSETEEIDITVYNN